MFDLAESRVGGGTNQRTILMVLGARLKFSVKLV
jgi:hypothetical protein